MAAVSVFVDDAVRGRLPLVCAKTGEPADLVIRMQRPVGGGLHGMAWLLVFLGPPGWAALILLYLLAGGDEYLTVRIPEVASAYEREKALKRFRLAALVLAPASLAFAFVYPGMFPALWLALSGALLVAAIAVQTKISAMTIGVHLDASRRWVTLTGVHPAFVAAVAEQELAATAADR